MGHCLFLIDETNGEDKAHPQESPHHPEETSPEFQGIPFMDDSLSIARKSSLGLAEGTTTTPSHPHNMDWLILPTVLSKSASLDMSMSNTKPLDFLQNGVPQSPMERFLLEAANPKVGTDPNERLDRILQAKYEAGFLKPFNYASSYGRFLNFMELVIRF